MTILQIAILALLAIVLGQLPRGRQLAMLAISTFVVFWLQPDEPFVTLKYWLPLATIAFVVLTWALTSSPEVRSLQDNWEAIAVLVTVIVLADLNRYFGLEALYITTTPILPLALAALTGIAAVAFLLARPQRVNIYLLSAAFISIILVFIFLKTPALASALLSILGRLHGEAPPISTAALSWLGFSYIAFRLMHTIRDRQSGRLPAVTLAEYANYVIFFPAFTAGPIDRVERFVRDLRSPLALANEDWVDAGTRLFVGLFKKFVIADLLAVISINNTLVAQVKSAGWMWVFLYAYAFRIFFDFSGYTDIAIGMGRLMGIRLPENFAAPYLKPNLTQFWNSWHMTLTQWFRSYFFNPLTRALRSMRWTLPIWIIVLFTQVSTMVLIGLWHGITWGFVVWGLWHGIGLFLHNRWSAVSRNRMPAWAESPRAQFPILAAGIFLTFNYVALGWLFFTLSSPGIAWLALQKLFGFA